MICPYCNSEVRDGSKFCTECGATLNAAAVRRQTGEVAAGTGMLLGTAARQARLNTAVSEDRIISERAYNGVLLGVLLWGLLVNLLLCAFAGGAASRLNPMALLIGYAVCALAGVLITKASQKPLVSFLGYNLVVVPFGLVISVLVEAYGGMSSQIVTDAFLYTLLIALGMTGAALDFPRLFSRIGGALLGVLAGLLICELVLLLMGRYQDLTDWIAAGLFSLYVGYDVYRAQQFPKSVDNAVDSALDIYLDLANLFIRLLSLMAKRRD